jgi:hypothetical protein
MCKAGHLGFMTRNYAHILHALLGRLNNWLNERQAQEMRGQWIGKDIGSSDGLIIVNID